MFIVLARRSNSNGARRSEPNRSGTSIIQVSGIPVQKFRVARRKMYVVRRPYQRKTFAAAKDPNNIAFRALNSRVRGFLSKKTAANIG
ncbi:hypothetical protein [Caballeronia sp. INDeC2]|uniref:hypothetical protein n=1 Tax=Caballeronia sp. INDeC2 TaxID=2921747 RepID=UPI00202988AA|nr:hypothetical protein [Caballeronia sp. INDeC2]